MKPGREHVLFPGLRSRFGISRWDITPGLDVCTKNWGAGKNWFSTGVHRPLTGTALAISGPEQAHPLVLVSLDLGWWRTRADADRLRFRLLEQLGLPESQLIVHLTHTHAGPLLDSDPPPQANPAATRKYWEQLPDKCLDGVLNCLGSLFDGTLRIASGWHHLAAQRDLQDPETPGRYLTGFNPESTADNTLLAGQLCDTSGVVRGTLVNYACHPTTLAWDNHLISPDFPGAMREIVESTTSAPCLFLQGASGELAPIEQYSGHPEVADRHGRSLGHACLSLLESMRGGQNAVRFEGCLESGAPLALWSPCNVDFSTQVAARTLTVDLPVRQDLPPLQALEAKLAQHTSGFAYERLLRQIRVRKSVGDENFSRETLWCWDLGEAVLVGIPFEAYSSLQMELRRSTKRPVIVLNLANGSLGYLPPRALYQQDAYAAWQTPYGPGSLESVTEALRTACTNPANPVSSSSCPPQLGSP